MTFYKYYFECYCSSIFSSKINKEELTCPKHHKKVIIEKTLRDNCWEEVGQE